MKRRMGESQRAYVERVLRADGSIATYGVLYGLEYESGERCSITRLAAIIHELRAAGWSITTSEPGELAVYRLVFETASWRCIDCGAAPILPVSLVLGGMGQSRCDSCHALRYFRRAA